MTTEAKPRNYSFLHKKNEMLDSVERGKDEFPIPATPGTTYWAILKFFYENADNFISPQQAIAGVREILEDRDPDKWDKFISKPKVRTFKEGKVIEKDTSPWQSRLENNIKTLTRTGGNNPYGKRLTERGHILQWDPDALSHGAYILRTNTNEPLRKGRGRRKKKI